MYSFVDMHKFPPSTLTRKSNCQIEIIEEQSEFFGSRAIYDWMTQTPGVYNPLGNNLISELTTAGHMMYSIFLKLTNQGFKFDDSVCNLLDELFQIIENNPNEDYTATETYKTFVLAIAHSFHP